MLFEANERLTFNAFVRAVDLRHVNYFRKRKFLVTVPSTFTFFRTYSPCLPIPLEVERGGCNLQVEKEREREKGY